MDVSALCFSKNRSENDRISSERNWRWFFNTTNWAFHPPPSSISVNFVCFSFIIVALKVIDIQLLSLGAPLHCITSEFGCFLELRKLSEQLNRFDFNGFSIGIRRELQTNGVIPERIRLHSREIVHQHGNHPKSSNSIRTLHRTPRRSIGLLLCVSHGFVEGRFMQLT